MNNSLSSLHPNPGWAGGSSSQPVGKHCILELYDCNPGKLNDEAFIRTTIATAAREAGATVLHLISHHFQPQGVTGLVLLAESHLSIHTWPDPCLALVEALAAGHYKLSSFLRDTALPAG